MASPLRDGRYVLVRPLGEGAHGETFEARDEKDGRQVAIKRFSVRGASSWKDVELAEREARVLASLHHPKLPAYLDRFEEDGALYLVMELIEGESLASMRKRGASLGEADVVRLLRDASEVLDYLHGRAPPVIHRDLKPGNVIRRPDGSFAFVDFGAVRDKLRPDGGSTVVGTFGYMAPEQFQGRAQPASDVYAIGATALAMLTGEEPERLPHEGLAIDVERALRGAARPALARVLARMLEPDPDVRPSRIAPLLDEPRRHDATASSASPGKRGSRGASRRRGGTSKPGRASRSATRTRRSGRGTGPSDGRNAHGRAPIGGRSGTARSSRGRSRRCSRSGSPRRSSRSRSRCSSSCRRCSSSCRCSSAAVFARRRGKLRTPDGARGMRSDGRDASPRGGSIPPRRRRPSRRRSCGSARRKTVASASTTIATRRRSTRRPPRRSGNGKRARRRAVGEARYFVHSIVSIGSSSATFEPLAFNPYACHESFVAVAVSSPYTPTYGVPSPNFTRVSLQGWLPSPVE